MPDAWAPEVKEECEASTEMPVYDPDEKRYIDYLTTVHVCGLPSGHGRRHICRKPDCDFWWEAYDHNPFATEVRKRRKRK